MADDDKAEDRANLADVLGALVTSVGRARVQSDLSAIEIARLYQRHELLRGMPVPRLRLNRVEVNIPLVVGAVKPAEPYVLAEPKDAAKVLLEDLGRALKSIEILNAQVSDALEDGQVIDPETDVHTHLTRLNACLKDLRHAFEASLNSKGTAFHFETRFTNALERALAVFRERGQAMGAASALDVQEAAQKAILGVLSFRIATHRKSVQKSRPDGTDFDLADYYPQILGEKDPVQIKKEEWGEYAEECHRQLLAAITDLMSEMSARASIRAFSRPEKVPDIEIAADTADVKNLGTPGTVTQLRIIMSEEGLEWVAESTDDGGRDWKLTRE